MTSHPVRIPEEDKPQPEILSETELTEQFIARSHSGPLPLPEILGGYDQVLPGTASKIVQTYEIQGTHRRDLEKKAQLDMAKSKKRGQWMGFILALCAFHYRPTLFTWATILVVRSLEEHL